MQRRTPRVRHNAQKRSAHFVHYDERLFKLTSVLVHPSELEKST